jgi:hypothetical protein
LPFAWKVQDIAAPINPTWSSSFGSATIAAFKAAGPVQLISGGTTALGTAAIPQGACASPVTSSASGVAVNDTIIYNTNTDPTKVTGYAPSANGSLYIWAFPPTTSVSWFVTRLFIDNPWPSFPQLEGNAMRKAILILCASLAHAAIPLGYTGNPASSGGTGGGSISVTDPAHNGGDPSVCSGSSHDDRLAIQTTLDYASANAIPIVTLPAITANQIC